MEDNKNVISPRKGDNKNGSAAKPEVVAQTVMIPIGKIETNHGQIEGLPKNPRSWDADDVETLSRSIEETPELLEARPLIVVPQRRERAFVIGRRRDLNFPKIKMEFNERPVLFKEVIDKTDMTNDLTDLGNELFRNRRPSDHSLGDTSRRCRGKYSGFTLSWFHSNEVAPTLTTTDGIIYDFPRHMNEKEIKMCGTFPLDYKVPSRERMLWLAGMSVPPVMMAQISNQIYQQWLKEI